MALLELRLSQDSVERWSLLSRNSGSCVYSELLHISQDSVAQTMHAVSLLAAHSGMTQRLSAIVARQLAERWPRPKCLAKSASSIATQRVIPPSAQPLVPTLARTSNITTLAAVAQDMRTCVLQQATHEGTGRLM